MKKYEGKKIRIIFIHHKTRKLRLYHNFKKLILTFLDQAFNIRLKLLHPNRFFVEEYTF